MNIGFIGLGLMGEAMASNIIKKHPEKTYVFDLDTTKVEKLVELGAGSASSGKEIAGSCDIVISMVPKSAHVRAVYEEMFEVMRPGQIYIDMSTIDPQVSVEVSEKAAEKGAVMLDAPVVKSRAAALEGKLGIYVGGDKDAYEKIKFILDYMGCNVIYLGKNGSGLVMKILHNMMVAQIQNAVNETLSMAESYGIGYDEFAEAISYGGGQNFYLDSKLEVIKNKTYETAFSVENMNKDVNIALGMAAEKKLYYPGMELVQKLYGQAMESGSRQDFSYLYEVVTNNKEA